MRPLPSASAKSVPLTLHDVSSVTVFPHNSVISETINAKAASIPRRLRAFLRSLGMTVYQISQMSARPLFGKGTRAYIRDALYAEIESGQMPDIHQLAAMAKLTGYRLVDWLTLFGYNVDDILRLQLELHRERTVVLPSTIYDPLALLPWIRQLSTSFNLERAHSLMSVIDAIGYVSLGELDQLNRRRFLYARVGQRDLMRPSLVAGSVVRVDPTRTTVAPNGGLRPLYLVRHLGGLSCCYVDLQDDQYVILLPDDDVYRVMRCRIGTEAIILGMIDLELRLLQGALPDLSAPQREERHNGRARLSDPLTERGAGAYARAMRERIRVSFREAQAITRRVAAHFEDDRYEIALGSLSDAETYDGLPRNISRIFSLCIAYCMDLWEYLRAGGVAVDELTARRFLDSSFAMRTGTQTAPRRSRSPRHQARTRRPRPRRTPGRSAFLPAAINRIDNQPGTPLARDMYIWSNGEPVFHPVLDRAMLLFVNRRQHRVPDLRSRPAPGRAAAFPHPRARQALSGRDLRPRRRRLLVCPHSTSRMPVLAYPARDVVVIGGSPQCCGARPDL